APTKQPHRQLPPLASSAGRKTVPEARARQAALQLSTRVAGEVHRFPPSVRPTLPGPRLAGLDCVRIKRTEPGVLPVAGSRAVTYGGPNTPLRAVRSDGEVIRAGSSATFLATVNSLNAFFPG